MNMVRSTMNSCYIHVALNYVSECVHQRIYGAFTCRDQIYVGVHLRIHLMHPSLARDLCIFLMRVASKESLMKSLAALCSPIMWHKHLNTGCTSIGALSSGQLAWQSHVSNLRGNQHIFDWAVISVQSSRTGVPSKESCTQMSAASCSSLKWLLLCCILCRAIQSCACGTYLSGLCCH